MPLRPRKIPANLLARVTRRPLVCDRSTDGARRGMMKTRAVKGIVLWAAHFVAGSAQGQEHSDADFAKATQNPVADLISLPIQNNTNFDLGPGDDTQNILNIQPV